MAENAAFSGGHVDVSAERQYARSSLAARVRLVVFCDGARGELTIAETGATELSLSSYALGDDDRTQRDAIAGALAPFFDPAAALDALHAAAYPEERSLVDDCRVPAPPARATASAIAELDTTAAFAAIDAIRGDLLAFDLDVIADDLSLLDDAAERAAHARHSLAFRAASCDLLHVVLVTASTLAEKSARLVQTTLGSSETRWIDVVPRDAFAEFAAHVTSHYDAQFRARQFERA